MKHKCCAIMLSPCQAFHARSIIHASNSSKRGHGNHQGRPWGKCCSSVCFGTDSQVGELLHLAFSVLCCAIQVVLDMSVFSQKVLQFVIHKTKHIALPTRRGTYQHLILISKLFSQWNLKVNEPCPWFILCISESYSLLLQCAQTAFETRVLQQG